MYNPTQLVNLKLIEWGKLKVWCKVLTQKSFQIKALQVQHHADTISCQRVCDVKDRTEVECLYVVTGDIRKNCQMSNGERNSALVRAVLLKQDTSLQSGLYCILEVEGVRTRLLDGMSCLFIVGAK